LLLLHHNPNNTHIYIAATNYMSMFYLFFGIEKKRVKLEKNTFRGETK